MGVLLVIVCESELHFGEFTHNQEQTVPELLSGTVSMTYCMMRLTELFLSPRRASEERMPIFPPKVRTQV